MGAVFDLLFGHTLFVMLSLGALLAFLWLLRCGKRMGLRWYSSLVVSILHAVLGVLSVYVFAILESGFDQDAVGNLSLFGGVFFMPLFYWAVAKWRKVPFSLACDLLTPCMICIVMCARVNCILSGCCFGALIPFPGLNSVRWPTRELEVAFYLVLLTILVRKVLTGENRGQIYPIYMMAYGVFRFIIEFLRVSSRSVGLFHLSHLWALMSFAIGLGIYAELRAREKHAKKKHERR